MNKVFFSFIIFCELFCNSLILAQEWYDDFSDKQNSTTTWVGDWSHFAINKNQQLQSQSSEAAESILLHRSTSSIAAEWLCWVRISGTCSAYNLVRYYVTLDGNDIHSNGYFVQIGGSNKDITLYEQYDGVTTKIIEHSTRKKCLDTDASYVRIRVTREPNGIFHLYSWIENLDTTWIEEGSYFAPMVRSTHSAIYVKNTKTRGYDFYIDDIYVSGEPQYKSLSQNTTIEGNLILQLLSENISPNGDGWEDKAYIKLTLPDDNYTATLSVYTTNGVLVNEVYNQTPIGRYDTLCWDGSTSHGSLANIGIYVLYIQLQNSKTNDVYRQHLAVTLML